MVPIEYLLGFIREDAPFGDVTSEAVIPEISCHATIRAEDAGIIAGLEEAQTLFEHFGITVERTFSSGTCVKKGDPLLALCGNAKKILLVERTALNIIGRMSGIATKTRKIVDLVKVVNPHCRVACTRKTCPGFRVLDKRAVLVGGGDPHRSCLSDGILIKDNHLMLVSIEDALRAAKRISAYKCIEIEVQKNDDVLTAARAGSDIIMLDNMSPDQIRQNLRALEREGLRDRVIIEVSGGVDEGNIITYAKMQVDVISLGSLTHSVSNFSVNLEIHPD